MYGVSFSLHRCHELQINKQRLLQAAIKDLGFRKFRLMSYWNVHEQNPGQYDFSELDWQMDLVAKHKGEVSLCLGKRQPRWPECHLPDWATTLSKAEWYAALFHYIEVVVERYKNHPALTSWQLENEALLKNFGYCRDQDYSRKRLRSELDLVRRLDPKHPIIMTLSDSWGLPVRRPRPDMYGMSLYIHTVDNKGKSHASKRPPSFYRFRAAAIGAIQGRPVFIHELQAEPWISQGITSAPLEEQLDRMNPGILTEILAYADATRMQPIYLWGLEWWYWLKTAHKDDSMWNTVKAHLQAH